MRSHGMETFLAFSLCEHFFAHEMFNTSMGDTFGILVLVMLQKIPINTVYCINLSYAGLQNQEVWYKQDHQ